MRFRGGRGDQICSQGHVCLLTTTGGGGAGCPGVASLLSTCPVFESTTVPELPMHIQVSAIPNREGKAQSWGWGGAHRPRPRAHQGRGGRRTID